MAVQNVGVTGQSAIVHKYANSGKEDKTLKEKEGGSQAMQDVHGALYSIARYADAITPPPKGGKPIVRNIV